MSNTEFFGKYMGEWEECYNLISHAINSPTEIKLSDIDLDKIKLVLERSVEEIRSNLTYDKAESSIEGLKVKCLNGLMCCDNCGVALPYADNKYCHRCGAKFTN